MVIVVGSPNSSNSNRLREVAANRGVRAYMIDRADAARARVGRGQVRPSASRRAHRPRKCWCRRSSRGSASSARATCASSTASPNASCFRCRRAWPGRPRRRPAKPAPRRTEALCRWRRHSRGTRRGSAASARNDCRIADQRGDREHRADGRRIRVAGRLGQRPHDALLRRRAAAAGSRPAGRGDCRAQAATRGRRAATPSARARSRRAAAARARAPRAPRRAPARADERDRALLPAGGFVSADASVRGAGPPHPADQTTAA